MDYAYLIKLFFIQVSLLHFNNSPKSIYAIYGLYLYRIFRGISKQFNDSNWIAFSSHCNQQICAESSLKTQKKRT